MTNNKLLVMLLLFFCMTSWSNAAQITQEQAKQEATSFLIGKHNGNKVMFAARGNKQLKEAATSEAAYYVFNIGDNQGFIIVSADDRTNPILGYSDEGYFDEAKLPANMRAWLDEYALQITQLDEVKPTDLKNVLAAPKIENVDTRNSIAPMITTKWDQATPYWNECPQFMNSDNEEDGYELAYTGCVATSVSQIMNFHKYPEQTTQVIPAYTFTVSDGNYNYSTVQMPELDITTFDWAHIRDTYTGAEDEVYTSAVAHLMFYVGCALKSQYGISATGAYTDDIPKAFELFGYASKLAYRNDYTQEVWDEMVYQELAAGRPMIYNGTAGSGGGHSFICDGYEYGNYFHINWGWGGMGNGYFQLAIMNPYASGIGGSSSAEGYNMKQNIVYNIIPSDNQLSVDNALTATNISPYSTSFERSSVSQGFSLYKSKYITVNYSDHTGTQKKYDVGIAFYDMNDNFVSMITNMNFFSTALTSAVGSSWKAGGNNTSSDPIRFGAGMTGTYKIVPMYMLQGTNEWKPMLKSERYYIECSMTATHATMTAHPIINLQATNWQFTGGEKVGVKEQVNVTVKNNSEEDFFGDLYLDFGGQQLDEYSQYTTVVTAEVLAGQESVVTFNVRPTSSGIKTVKLMTFADLSYKTIGQTTVTIAPSAEAEEINLSVVIKAENAATEAFTDGDNVTFGTIYDTHVCFSATITNHSNGEYNKYILAPLFLVSKNESGGVEGGSMVTYKQETISLQAGETKTFYFNFDNLAYGSTYSMNIYARNNVPDSENASHVDNIVEKGKSLYYDILPGIITWTGDGIRSSHIPTENFQVASNVAAVGLEGLSLNSIVPNNNPNTLYFLDEDASTPSSLNGKNVVKGSIASNILLIDGYDYFTPQSFTAQSISYERTFSKARTANVAENWTTIVLPFTPSTVSSTDIWVERFSQENNGKVLFSEVENIEANVPYIIAAKKTANLTSPITWSASNVLLKPEPIAYTSGEAYLMTGSFFSQSLDSIYAVNSAGSHAKWASGSQSVAPFRAYFKEIETLDSHADIPLPGEEQQGGVEEVTLAELIASGTVGNEYSISNPLTIVYVSDDCKTVYAKDDNQFALRNQVPYIPTEEQLNNYYVYDYVELFDQSNWIAINLPQALEDNEYYLNGTISDLQGILNDKLNPEITLESAPTITLGDSRYIPNIMMVANFDDENTYFLVPPKPQEIVNIRWAIYENGAFYMPKSNNSINSEHFNGVVKIADNSIIGSNFFDNKVMYNLKVIVKALCPRTASIMYVSSNSIEVEPGNISPYYEINVIDAKANDIPTSIDNIDRGQDMNDTYYNLMGQPVVNPTPGIYIHNGKKVIIR